MIKKKAQRFSSSKDDGRRCGGVEWGKTLILFDRTWSPVTLSQNRDSTTPLRYDLQMKLSNQCSVMNGDVQ